MKTTKMPNPGLNHNRITDFSSGSQTSFKRICCSCLIMSFCYNSTLFSRVDTQLFRYRTKAKFINLYASHVMPLPDQGKVGNWADWATIQELILSPSALIAPPLGPKNIIPLRSNKSGSFGFSLAWPQPAQTASTFLRNFSMILYKKSRENLNLFSKPLNLNH